MVHLLYFPVSHRNRRKMWVDYWGGGGAKGMLAPLSNFWGPGPPPSSYAYASNLADIKPLLSNFKHPSWLVGCFGLSTQVILLILNLSTEISAANITDFPSESFDFLAVEVSLEFMAHFTSLNSFYLYEDDSCKTIARCHFSYRQNGL